MLSSARPLHVLHVCPVQLDHFRHTPAAAGGDDNEDDNTFQQRYFVCSEYWGAASGESGSDGEGGEDSRRGNDAPSASRAGRGGERAAPGALGPIFFYVSFSLLSLRHADRVFDETHGVDQCRSCCEGVQS